MSRQTAAQRATARQMAEKLAEYYQVHEEKLAIDKDDRRLRKATDAVPEGQWGDYIKTRGNPRVIPDTDAIAKHFSDLGEEVPTKLAYPLIVRKVSK